VERLRVEVDGALLRWARERSGRRPEDIVHAFPRLPEWEQGESAPTFKQLEAYAKATYTPFGYFFLPEPPVETLPIPDFRTMGGTVVGRPSANLLDTLYICQQRQDWYREYAQLTGEPSNPFVGSATLGDSVEATAARMREALNFDLDARRNCPTWTDALRQFIAQADAAGVLVMCSGVAGSNNRRTLDPSEFRGFALADPYAPLIFINGADTKAAQMFTVAHELAHIWLGQTALSDAGGQILPSQRVEAWCNRVAAELLVPLAVMRQECRMDAPLWNEVSRLARRFKVSTLVILRRMFDAGMLDWAGFQAAYAEEESRLRDIPKGSGGDFYLTQAARVSRRFARALLVSTLEGMTLYRDAYRMLGVSRPETFNEMGRSLGVSL
jgi:Zn-dependent peptidase ImmA (M78 family)